MMTIAKLKTRTVKDLAAMARKKKVSGWHTMRKDELITALLKTAARAARQNSSAAAGAGRLPARSGRTTAHRLRTLRRRSRQAPAWHAGWMRSRPAWRRPRTWPSTTWKTGTGTSKTGWW